MTVSAYGVTLSSPSVAMTMVRAPRARTSCTLLISLACSAWRGAMTMTGVPGSINAIGPCLISPAGKPSADT